MRLAFSLLFPWSGTSVRAIVLFATVFPVLILRKADLHGGCPISVLQLANAQCSRILPPFYDSFRSLERDCFAQHDAYYDHLLDLSSRVDMPVPPQHRPSCEVNHNYVAVSLYMNKADIRSGYELPRLNERFVYMLFFSTMISIVYGFLQKALHRTLLPYNPVSVSLHSRSMLTFGEGPSTD